MTRRRMQGRTGAERRRWWALLALLALAPIPPIALSAQGAPPEPIPSAPSASDRASSTSRGPTADHARSALMAQSLLIEPDVADPTTPPPDTQAVHGALTSLEEYTRSSRAVPPSTLAMTALTTAAAAAVCPTLNGQTPPEIVELARALKNSPDLIYEYVYDNIKTLHEFNSLKGPVGALIDGAGSAFDQAELMVCLLAQAGYSASYMMGNITLTAAQISQWLGTDQAFNSIYSALGDGGIPATINGNPTVTSVTMAHIWVRVNIGGTNYVFDPATKAYARKAPIANLAGIMGYSASTFFSRAKSGSVANTKSVADIAGLNVATLNADLTTFATNLASWLRANAPAASTEDILGGTSIVPLPLDTRQRITSLPYQSGTVNNVAAIPDANRAKLTVTLPGASPISFNSSDLYGHRLSLWMIPNGSQYQPTLYFDATQKGAAGTAVAASTNVAVTLAITHNYTNGVGQQSGTVNLSSTANGWNGTYLICNGWGMVSRGMVEKHRKLLAENMSAWGPTYESVLGESLATVGFTWMAQVSRVQQIVDQLVGSVSIRHHYVGMVGMKAVGSDEGPYVDLPFNLVSTTQLTGRTSGGGAFTPLENAAFYTTFEMLSVFESGTIEQTQPGIPAASTVKILSMNSRAGDAQASPIFDINNGAISYPGGGQSYYTNTIRPQLAAHGWTAKDLTRVDNLVAANWRVMAALKGNTTVDLWTGTGYYAINPQNGTSAALITGGLSGGMPAHEQPISALSPATSLSSRPPSIATVPSLLASSAGGGGGSARTFGTIGDPVNQVTGDFTYSHEDISVGSGEFPYALTFKRVYDSSLNLQGGALGVGWTHNFAWSAKADSDGFDGMGANSPVSGSAAIAAIFVLKDLLYQANNVMPLDHFMVTTAVSKWLMDQLTHNVVAVTQPGNTEHFIRLADGSYNAELGSVNKIALNGTYTLTTKEKTQYAFNSAGDLARIAFPSGPAVTLSYSGGKLTSVGNGMGRTLTLSYSGNNLTAVSDGTGRSIGYTYFSDYNGLATVIDTAKKLNTFWYGDGWRLTRIYSHGFPNTPLVTNTYDTLGRIQSQTEADGHRTDYYFAGSRTEMVAGADDASLAASTVSYFTPRGRVRAVIDAVGAITTTAYDGLDRPIKATLPEGNDVEMTYDASSNPLTVKATPKPGSGLAPTQKSYTYDAKYNQVHTVTDELGRKTTYNYDAATGNLLQTVYPTVNGQTPVETFAYNGRGQLVDHWSAAGSDVRAKRTHNTYDGTMEILTGVVDDYGGLNLSTTYGYDSVGNRTHVTDANGHTTVSAYDTERRLIKVTAPAPFNASTVTYAYDYNGNLLSTTKSDGVTSQTNSFTYLPSGRTLTATEPQPGQKITFTYDALDRPATVTDAENRVIRFGYDKLDRLVSVTNAAIQAAPLEAHDFGANGKERHRRDARGQVTTYDYDGFDRLQKITYPDGSYEAFSFDNVGNMLTRRTRSGSTIAMSYDALDRMYSKAPTGEPAIVTSFDSAGRTTAVSDGKVAFSYGYDSAWRQTSTTRSDNHQQVALQLDKAGNRVRLTWPEGYYVTYGFDALDRLTDVKETGSVALVHYDYDGLNRRTRAVYGDGTSTTYGFSPNNDVSSLTHTFVGSSVSFTYPYNLVHQRKGVSSSDRSYLWYPPAASTVNYVVKATVDQYQAVGGVTQGYDGNANLSGDGVSGFAYDTENRLTRVSSGGHTYTYAYDALGRRMSKSTNGTVTMAFLHAGDQEIAEYGGSGNLVRRYVYGPGIDEPVAAIDGAGNKTFFHQDALGSVVASTDGSSAAGRGHVTAHYGYGPYGASPSLIGDGFGFAGRRLDEETGLYYSRARYYSPTLGRFLQPDPIGYEGGANLYAYVNDDPINKTDPMGTGPNDGPQLVQPTWLQRLDAWNQQYNPYTILKGQIYAAFLNSGTSYADNYNRAAARQSLAFQIGASFAAGAVLGSPAAAIGEYPTNIIPGTLTVDVPGSLWTRELNIAWMNGEMRAGTTFLETSPVTRAGTFADLERPMLQANPQYVQIGSWWINLPNAGGAATVGPYVNAIANGGYAASPEPPPAFERATVESAAPARHGTGTLGQGSGDFSYNDLSVGHGWSAMAHWLPTRLALGAAGR